MKKESTSVTIPVTKAINQEELVNTVASFICAKEEIPLPSAVIGKEGNFYVIQASKNILDSKGKVCGQEKFVLQINFLPNACIVNFETTKGKVEKKRLNQTVSTAVGVEAGLIGIGTMVTAASTGAIMIGLSPLAIAALPIGGAMVALHAASAGGKAKKSRQLKEEIFELVRNYIEGGSVIPTETAIPESNADAETQQDSTVENVQ